LWKNIIWRVTSTGKGVMVYPNPARNYVDVEFFD
jgi:hypothetical protein